MSLVEWHTRDGDSWERHADEQAAREFAAQRRVGGRPVPVVVRREILDTVVSEDEVRHRLIESGADAILKNVLGILGKELPTEREQCRAYAAAVIDALGVGSSRRRWPAGVGGARPENVGRT